MVDGAHHMNSHKSCSGCFYLCGKSRDSCKRFQVKLPKDSYDTVKKLEGCEGPFKKPQDIQFEENK